MTIEAAEAAAVPRDEGRQQVPYSETERAAWVATKLRIQKEIDAAIGEGNRFLKVSAADKAKDFADILVAVMNEDPRVKGFHPVSMGRTNNAIFSLHIAMESAVLYFVS